MISMLNLKMGLVKGRHEIPEVTQYIFQGDLNPLDLQGLHQVLNS